MRPVIKKKLDLYGISMLSWKIIILTTLHKSGLTYFTDVPAKKKKYTVLYMARA
jgi:hypothetical protein